MAHSRSFRWFTKATEGEDTAEMVDITGDHGDDSSEMLCEL
ncbi:hypothetical protein [Halogeometricum pallidum]|nr:hypothetical protein [Halogeometricum pallidum]